ncbi:serine protein kinase PrkA [Myxococcota bacterium]|nr:serine protein kinase PrkA [Myxococcota bacterium]MBU1432038.1 serine protein kinase PrkA [Myxococcota bacterium]MBU1899022.1 serine protein kinase PrkA [Myxococcota bacterium]
MTPSVPAGFLDALISSTQARFASEKVLLSLPEYLDVLAADPGGQARDAAGYLRDVFLYYGVEEVSRPYGRATRYRLFDRPFDEGRGALIGQERVQQAVFDLLSGFVQEGRVSKLILLHGPNGSAKSRFIACLQAGLEDYSQTPQGALYTFNWVFPSKRLHTTGIGFGKTRGAESLESYAYLKEGEIDARIINEMRDHPLLLLPRDARVSLLRRLLGEAAALPKALTEGALSPKARQIYDALLKAYQGDLREVFKHVQVERFYISPRYRRGAVVVDPQMRVDAGVRQITADRSLSALPPSLQNLTLYEPVGDLVDANRGIIEYNDLLKRPLEAFKYLLSTCETGNVRLDTMTLSLDTVFIGSCNALHLAAFKEAPDFASFKGRIELVAVPYLVDYRDEARIYAEQTDPQIVGRPVAPYTAEVTALWGVLTRLERPIPAAYPKGIRVALGRMSPQAKALLYAEGRLPSGLDREAQRTLAAHIPELHAERKDSDFYEGRFGASPRELKAVLLQAAQRGKILTPMAVLDELDALCTQTSVYEFLRLKPDNDYHKFDALRAAVEAFYLEALQRDMHEAMGLVDATATQSRFLNYIDDVKHFIKQEKRHNPATGQYEAPSPALMTDIERRLGVHASVVEFRNSLMQQIAAWRMDHPAEELDLAVIFADKIHALSESYYAEKAATARRVLEGLLIYTGAQPDKLDADIKPEVTRALEALEGRYGYHRETLKAVITFMLSAKEAG